MVSAQHFINEAPGLWCDVRDMKVAHVSVHGCRICRGRVPLTFNKVNSSPHFFQASMFTQRFSRASVNKCDPGAQNQS